MRGSLGLGLKLGINGGRGSGGVFNPLLGLIGKYGVPALLFDNTEVYTDAAGTLPAGIGDVGGNEADLSGGSHDVSQAVTAAKPILRAGPLLEFDGTDDALTRSEAVFSGDELTFIICGNLRAAPAATESLFSFGDSLSVNNYCALLSTVAGGYQFFAQNTLGNINLQHPTVDETARAVITVRLNGLTGIIRYNQTNGGTGVTTALDLSASDQFSLGASFRGASLLTFSKLDSSYVFAINKSVTDSEMSQAEEFIANGCGVTLP